MNTKRIQKLIDFMAALPRSAEKHFNMLHWLSHPTGGHTHEFGEFIRPADLKHCGTTACALGWASSIPAFRKAGLKIRRDGGIDAMATIENFDTAQKFFALTESQAANLFGAPATPLRAAKTPKAWARGARKLVRQWERGQASSS